MVSRRNNDLVMPAKCALNGSKADSLRASAQLQRPPAVLPMLTVRKPGAAVTTDGGTCSLVILPVPARPGQVPGGGISLRILPER